jgi:two-component system OmpR family response regulator
MIEDDPEMAKILTKFLSSYEMEVTNVEEPYLGLSKLELNEYDLLILDLTLPEIDGLELIPKIREKSDIPIIISSARDDITDKVIGLERGADDYLPKPYNPRELEARIKSLLRRKRPKNRDLKIVKNDSPFKLNEEQMSISYKDKLLQLTKAEYEILAYLIKHKNGVVSRADIIYNIDAISDDSTYKNIDVIISRIRSKLAKIDPDSSLIKSVRGVGYKLTV